ncbi:MAG TPA: M2 family metallopeptidase [Planctomycetota bacterium]|nr:M2 family metallopeptidase [Planctomycetota bacterium]
MARVHLALLAVLGMSIGFTPEPLAAGGAGDPAGARVRAARELVAGHEARIRPLEKDAALAWWRANTTGKDEDFQAKEEAQNRIDAALADPGRFAELKEIKKGLEPPPPGLDPVLGRQIQVLYLQYLEKQVDPELLKKMTARANAVEKAFNVFRAKVGGKEMTDSQVKKVLKDSLDSSERKDVWEASKAVGAVVEADLKELVKLRNEAARKIGYRDFHALQLELNEQSQEQVLALFDELDELTREPFRAVKAGIDVRLAKSYGITVADLRPWHYHDPFFQETPSVFDTDLDRVYEGVDILKVCRELYSSIGLPIDDVIARSDLYERKGKSPHAFCTDIDREGDVRVLANIVPNERWMGTMLHELGHAVYSSKNIPATVPYVLRTEAHTLTTEGIAMLFERFSTSGDWLQKRGVAVPDLRGFNESGSRTRRFHLLIFAAWCQVMFRFEKEMYASPERDLGDVWWGLVEKYQLLRRPEGRSAPDYASKIHVVSAPAYYHNYLLGQLFASQVHHTIAREVLKTPPAAALYDGEPRVGEFLKGKIFGLGRTLPWNALTRHATGEDLNARAFAADFRTE